MVITDSGVMPIGVISHPESMIELPDWAIDIVRTYRQRAHHKAKSTLDNIRKVGHSDLPTHDQGGVRWPRGGYPCERSTRFFG